MLANAETLKQFWLHQGVKLRRGATEEEFAAFELKYSIHLPADLREYLATVDGFVDSEYWMTDNEVITFLGLDEMKPLSEYWSPEVADANNHFVFADTVLAAHIYAIRLSSDSSDGNDVVVLYDRPVKVSRSFSEFVIGYLENCESVLFPEPQANNL